MRNRTRLLVVPLVLGLLLTLAVFQCRACAGYLWGCENAAVANHSGGTMPITAHIATAQSYDTTVTIAVTHSAAGSASAPSSVTIPAGQTSATFDLTYGTGASGDYITVSLADGTETDSHDVLYE